MTTTTTMATLLLLLLLLRASHSGADNVDHACKAIREFVNVGFCTAALHSSPIPVDVGFCTAALHSSPKSAGADLLGLLLVSVDLSIASGTSGKAAAEALSRGEPDAGVKNSLEACAILYGLSVPALQLFRGYAASRSWSVARSLLCLNEQAGTGCEKSLGEGAAGRMAKQNGDFDKLTTMVTALLNTIN